MWYAIALILYTVLVLLNIADYYTTTILLDAGHTELNPFLNEMIERSGTVQIILYIKVFFLMVLAIGLVPTHAGKLVVVMMGAATIAYVVVVYRSTLMLFNFNLI